jgi:predicted nuclease of predicted toxin-antitoxin system
VELFIDECLSPSLAAELNATGFHVAQHPRDFGGLGDPDHAVLRRCIDNNLVIVTQNARDFRALVATEEIHPGLIILPLAGKARSKELVEQAIAYLHTLGDPMTLMINSVLEIASNGSMKFYDRPTEY